jgi:hypothetical protein
MMAFRHAQPAVNGGAQLQHERQLDRPVPHCPADNDRNSAPDQAAANSDAALLLDCGLLRAAAERDVGRGAAQPAVQPPIHDVDEGEVS